MFTVETTKATTTAMSNNIRYNNRDLNDLRKDEGSISSTAIPNCDLEVSGERIRSGHHDTRKKLKFTTCRFILRGRTDDTVHVALPSYNLRYCSFFFFSPTSLSFSLFFSLLQLSSYPFFLVFPVQANVNQQVACYTLRAFSSCCTLWPW